MLVQHTSIQEYFDLLYVLYGNLTTKSQTGLAISALPAHQPRCNTNQFTSKLLYRLVLCQQLTNYRPILQKFNQTWITQDFFQEADMTKIGAQEMKAFCGPFFMPLILCDLFSFEHLHKAPSSDSLIILHS